MLFQSTLWWMWLLLLIKSVSKKAKEYVCQEYCKGCGNGIGGVWGFYCRFDASVTLKFPRSTVTPH